MKTLRMFLMALLVGLLIVGTNGGKLSFSKNGADMEFEIQTEGVAKIIRETKK